MVLYKDKIHFGCGRFDFFLACPTLVVAVTACAREPWTLGHLGLHGAVLTRHFCYANTESIDNRPRKELVCTRMWPYGVVIISISASPLKKMAALVMVTA